MCAQRKPHKQGHSTPAITMIWTQQLAPTGALRVCINLGNALLAQLDPTNQEPQGISVELAQALAKQLDAELQIQLVNTAKESVAAVANKEVDLGFFAIDPARAKDIAFTQAYLHIDACYVVRKVSAIHTEQDLDQTNSRIVVGLGSAYDLFLSRHIQKAELVRAPSTKDVMQVFWANGYEVAAGLQHAMSEEVKQHAQLRMLSPPFMAIAQAMGCHPTQSDEVKVGLQEFLVKQRPRIATSIAKHGLSGVKAA
jgi:polar amino acid transport system substrate-binding protein